MNHEPSSGACGARGISLQTKPLALATLGSSSLSQRAETVDMVMLKVSGQGKGLRFRVQGLGLQVWIASDFDQTIHMSSHP